MSTLENVQIVKDFFAAMRRDDKQGLPSISVVVGSRIEQCSNGGTFEWMMKCVRYLSA
ncbi:hypothetical protein [Paraburkholderia strydomiana]|jgi:hypothetical protein|uniref:hypothetical protein n=1 Tax=Paraburkholderia strydomiana TaxID=1245417 RepID=UPI0038BC9138